ncbi:MAG: DMT family transporter [Firmicutes bacterium]|nr:DMT family transporter [Bacillota bacterium]
MTTQRKADLALVLVTMCWGISYFLMDLCLEEMDPFTLNAWRFLGAFAVAAIATFPRLRGVNRETLKYALFVGMALTVVYIGCTFGVRYTSQSNAGFLCAMTVIFTPIFAFLFKRVVPGKKLFAVLVLCLAGIALMSLNEQLQIASGDLLCLMCAFAYAFDLLITEHAVARPEVNAYQLGVFQLLFCGIFMLVLAFLFETPCPPSSGMGWFGVIFLAIFCTGVSFIAQSVAQQYTTSTHVGVIFCLEPVFAGIVAFFLAGEVLLPRAYFGAFLMLAGLVIMEVDLPPRTQRKG